MRALTPGRLAGLALALHAGLVLLGVRHDAVTIDEHGHLPAGLAYLERGAFEINPQPPLVKLLGAAAAKAAGARSDYAHAWREAEARGAAVHYPALARDFMWANAEPPGHYSRIFRAARLVVLPFSLLLGLVLYHFGSTLFGPWGGLAACVLWCFSPDAIAHAALFTSDVPAASLMMAATYAFWRWLRTPTLSGAAACGALLGVAQLTKLSALSLYALWPLLALPSLLRSSGAAAERLRGLLPGAIVILTLSLGLLNLGYGLQGTGHRLGEPDYLSTTLTHARRARADVAPDHVYRDVYALRVNRFRGTALEGLPVPLPRAYLAGFDLQSFEARPDLPGAGWFVYLRGEVRKGGWPHYFVYALLVKSTPGLLLMLGAALLATALSPRARLPVGDEAFLFLPPLALLAAMSTTGVNLGVRYALPAVPFLMLATGRLARLLPARPAAATLALALGIHVASGLTAGSHALAYFSPLVGGSEAGARHLADSNLDWGQELGHLHRWLAERGVAGPVSAALYTALDPGILDLETRRIPRDPRVLRALGLGAEPDEPPCLAAGLHVLSANFVVGLPFRLQSGERVTTVPMNAYAYFAQLEPTGDVGHALRVYELTPGEAETLNRRLGLRCVP